MVLESAPDIVNGAQKWIFSEARPGQVLNERITQNLRGKKIQKLNKMEISR